MDSGVLADEDLWCFSQDYSPSFSSDVSLRGWLASLLRKHPGAIGDDMKKSRPNLGFLNIAAAFHFRFPLFFQGSPGPVGAEGSVGRPGPSGKKVCVISCRFQILRGKFISVLFLIFILILHMFKSRHHQPPTSFLLIDQWDFIYLFI